MFLKAAMLRNEMLAAGFTDNGGAIHSAERIIDILGLRLRYPALSHRNGLKNLDDAECSVAALIARRKNKPVHIEHVQPLRAFTAKAIEVAKPGKKGDAARLIRFVKANYRLVLLTPQERTNLDRSNRSKIDPNRLAGIQIKMLKAPRKKSTQ